MSKTWADFGIEIPPGRSGEIDVPCPECSGRRKKSREKCLSVNLETGIFYCHHCSWSGSLGINGDRLSWTAPPKVYERPPPPPAMTNGLPDQVVAWFASRGIDPEVVARARITAGPEFCPQKGETVQAIRFPYYRNGELVNIKFRAHPKHFWMGKGAERILYGLDDIQGADTICIVEGEMDKLAIDTVQAWPTVSVPDGAPAPDAASYGSKFNFLDGAEAIFEQATRIILATDMDAPGVKLADELARRLGPEKCARVRWPDGCKDANETLIKRGADAVASALADAQPYPVAGIYTVRDLADDIDRLYDDGYDRGCQIGWQSFDRHYRSRPGVLTVVTGIPGNGKSVFLDNVLMRLASQHHWRFAVCSPENQPLARHASQLLAIYQGKPFGQGPTERMTRPEMQAARLWLERYFTFVLPSEPTVDAILERALVLVKRQGITGLVVDPWNELEHSRPNGMSQTEYISQCLTRFRNFGRNYGVAVWIVAHPTKMRRDSETGDVPVPTPYDISDSAHWFNKADACFTVHRNKDDETEPSEVHVQKARFGELGEIGKVAFRYDKATYTFREA